uniref:Uncharacterized protein n=1 Tax=Anguilla anguilla TaxID=7936 RepID=A0A0E9XMS3_ANGAN
MQLHSLATRWHSRLTKLKKFTFAALRLKIVAESPLDFITKTKFTPEKKA